MKRKSILHFFIIIIFTTSVFFLFGQDTPIKNIPDRQHILSIKIGSNQIRDENLMNRVHKGFIITPAYEFRTFRKNYQEFTFDLGYSRLKADPQEWNKSLSILISASYSYCFSIAGKKNLSYFVGPQAIVSYRPSLYPDWDDSHMYWANYYAAGVNNIITYDFKNGNRLFSQLAFPLITIYSRPDLYRLYKIQDISFSGIMSDMNDNLSAGFWNNAFSIHFIAEYQFPVFKTKMESISYSFDYTSVKFEGGKPYNQIIHQVGLKIIL